MSQKITRVESVTLRQSGEEEDYRRSGWRESGALDTNLRLLSSELKHPPRIHLESVGDQAEMIRRTLIRTEKGYAIETSTQQVQQLVKELGLEKAKPAATLASALPKRSTVPRGDAMVSDVLQTQYRKAVGELLWISLDRPDIEFVAKTLSRRLGKACECDITFLSGWGATCWVSPRTG